MKKLEDQNHQELCNCNSNKRHLLDGKSSTYGLRHRKWSNTYHEYLEKREANYCFNSKKKEVKDTLKAVGDF